MEPKSHTPGTFEVATTDLLESIGSKSSQASFEALYERYLPRLMAFLRKRGLSPVAAKDMVQEVMLAIWKRADTFTSEKGGARSWILTIAKHRHIDATRRKSRQGVEVADGELASDAIALTEVELAEVRQLIDLALMTLPKEQAAVLRGQYFDGKSLADIADEQQLPLGTVKTRARLGMNTLKQTIGLR
jgi:RNA polymerase sigma factor (sigma-70 family)